MSENDSCLVEDLLLKMLKIVPGWVSRWGMMNRRATHCRGMSSPSLVSLLRCMGKNSHYFCFFIPIVVEVECMDLHHSHYGNRFSIA